MVEALRLILTMWRSEANAVVIRSHRRGDQKPTPTMALWPPPPPPPPLGRAIACCRACGSGLLACFCSRRCGCSCSRAACLRREGALPSSLFLREAVEVAGAGVVLSTTQTSPFSVSPALHSSGQTRLECLTRSATTSLVTTGLLVGNPSILL